jgi:Ca2+/H+ antiporter, TMEM165/GDT1 family
LPSLTSSLVIDAKAHPGSVGRLVRDSAGSSRSHPYADSGSSPIAPNVKPEVGTKDAPVDGLDGKPHAGPFVDSTKKKPVQQVEDLNSVAPGGGKGGKERTLLDDFELPEDDGVMSDIRDREYVKGPTGTEGGVSQKDRERKEKGQEGKKPDPPKEAPPLPGDKTTSKVKDGDGEAEKKKGAAGLEVC